MTITINSNIIYGGVADGVLNKPWASLGEMILSDLRNGDKRDLFVNGLTNQSIKYNELRNQSVSIAKSMHFAGVHKNDVIGIVSENRSEFPMISFAAFYLGAIVTPINFTYTDRELIHALTLSKPRFVFVSLIASEKMISIAKTMTFIEKVILLDGETNDKSAISMKDYVKTADRSLFNVADYVKKSIDIDNQVALIVYSSGTTGMPKGVQITHSNMISCLEACRSSISFMKVHQVKNQVVLNIAPWFHALGFMFMFMTACSGGAKFIYLAKFDVVAFLKSIEKYLVKTIVVVPPIMVFLAKSPLVDKYDLSSIEEINCGAAALSKDIEDQVKRRFRRKLIIRQSYGMSEATLGTLTSKEIVKAGSVGSPVQGIFAKIIDENGKSLGPNLNGELCFKGKIIMKGYINNPEATRETIDADGWLHSGDIGYYDDELQFYIVDRLKELIKYKAFQVAPAEVEGILLSHPKIKDAAVIGIPDEECGELPFAYIVKQPEVELTEKDVINFVAENSSKAKRLHGGVRFIDEIPKNPSGKILRRLLRDLYANTKIISKL
ncbi:unnamed protein product [Diamesa serratosioi]